MLSVKPNTNISELESLLGKMEAVRRLFVEETVIFIREFWHKKGMEFLNTHPQDSKKIDEAARGAYMRELDHLLHSGKERRIIEILDDRELWWHHNTGNTKEHGFYKDIDNIAGDRFREVLGEVGGLLFNYGLIWKSDEEPCFGFLSYKDANNLYIYKYVYPVYWSDGMKRRMDNYWELFKYASELYAKIQTSN